MSTWSAPSGGERSAKLPRWSSGPPADLSAEINDFLQKYGSARRGRDRGAHYPEGTKHLRAALDNPCVQKSGLEANIPARDPKHRDPVRTLERHRDDAVVLEWLLRTMHRDLFLRGLKPDRLKTFDLRIRACFYLMIKAEEPGFRIEEWTAKRPLKLPQRKWSTDQQAVIDGINAGVSVSDANVSVNSRYLMVTGGPGTGKTEVVIHAAVEAAAQGCHVLIACPVGALIKTYKEKLPPNDNIVVETIHSSFRITRRRDEQYIPPGRLRHYDLIIFDEISQQDPEVWAQVRVALAEMAPGPFVCFVGDFQQLQPVGGKSTLQAALERQVQVGSLQHIKLRQHEAARCNDKVMLDFLVKIREQQPTRAELRCFFHGRFLPANLDRSVAAAKRWEATSGKALAFLTVTNKGAAEINERRIAQDFPDAWRRRGVDGVPGDSGAGGGTMVFEPGMRIRLTQNVDKDRGFVNGAMGTIVEVLQKSVFILRSDHGVLILVHPVVRPRRDSCDSEYVTFMPCTYGYAMTMRRAQGSTLDAVALFFDRPVPDRGYSYVGSSRVRCRACLFHVGRVRRTDWLPVGGDTRDFGEQVRRSAASISGSEDELDDEMTESDGDSESEYECGDEFLSESDVEVDGDDEGFFSEGRCTECEDDIAGLF